MHPILISVGGFELHSYGAMGALGFLVMAFGVLRESRNRLGLDPENVADVIFWTSFTAIAGSRLLFVYQNPDGIDTLYDVVNVRGGGLVFYGALLTGLPIATWQFRKKKLPLWPMLDLFAMAMPIGHAFARSGCFLAGCCYGGPTDSAMGVIYTSPLTDAPHNVSLHPVQLYEAAGLLLIGAVVIGLRSRKRFDGQLLAIYLLLYAGLRLATEAFRGDERGWFLESLLGQAVSTSQGISALIVVCAVGIWATRQGTALAFPVPVAHDGAGSKTA